MTRDSFDYLQGRDRSSRLQKRGRKIQSVGVIPGMPTPSPQVWKAQLSRSCRCCAPCCDTHRNIRPEARVQLYYYEKFAEVRNCARTQVFALLICSPVMANQQHKMKLAVLTSGGDSAGMNAVVRAVVKAGILKCVFYLKDLTSLLNRFLGAVKLG